MRKLALVFCMVLAASTALAQEKAQEVKYKASFTHVEGVRLVEISIEGPALRNLLDQTRSCARELEWFLNSGEAGLPLPGIMAAVVEAGKDQAKWRILITTNQYVQERPTDRLGRFVEYGTFLDIWISSLNRRLLPTFKLVNDDSQWHVKQAKEIIEQEKKAAEAETKRASKVAKSKT